MLNMLRQPTNVSVVSKGLANETLRKYEELSLDEWRQQVAGAEKLREKAKDNAKIQ